MSVSLRELLNKISKGSTPSKIMFENIIYTFDGNDYIDKFKSVFTPKMSIVTMCNEKNIFILEK